MDQSSSFNPAKRFGLGIRMAMFRDLQIESQSCISGALVFQPEVWKPSLTRNGEGGTGRCTNSTPEAPGPAKILRSMELRLAP